ncbi:MAG: chemotaxis protein CheD [Rubrivivax sp.]|jgi:chemotaxis protein CheD|nr:chemotaxis protein CheD [Rubrivivax sp.]
MPTTDGDAVVLHPGDVRVGTRGERLTTLLGSCVAILLSDPRGTVGAMCHVVHPGRTVPPARHDTTRLHDAMAAMDAALTKLGMRASLCRAWVTGGGNHFPRRCPDGSDGDIGAANVRAALALLGEMGIPVDGQSLRGACYRKVDWTIGQVPRIEVVGIAPEETLA